MNVFSKYSTKGNAHTNKPLDTWFVITATQKQKKQNQGVENVILTDKQNISLLIKDKIYSISLPNIHLHDTTGIGDIFCATFCCTMLKENDFLWALCFAGGAAQAAIENKKLGLEKIPQKAA